MSKKPKKPQALIDAEAAVIAKKDEYRIMNEGLMRLKGEIDVALAKLKDARIEADAALPQCRLVPESRRLVIVGRAAHDILRVRDVGDHDGREYKFKYWGFSMNFRRWNGASSGFGRDALADVPEEFIPKKPNR